MQQQTQWLEAYSSMLLSSQRCAVELAHETSLTHRRPDETGATRGTFRKIESIESKMLHEENRS